MFPSLGGLEVTMSPSNRPLEEDHVILRCKADSLIYGNLTWFRVTNVSKSEQGTLAQPCRSLTLQPTPLSHAVLTPQPGTNVTLELSLRNASHQDEGLYACQVVNIITGEKTCLLHSVSLRGEMYSQHFLFVRNRSGFVK